MTQVKATMPGKTSEKARVAVMQSHTSGRKGEVTESRLSVESTYDLLA